MVKGQFCPFTSGQPLSYFYFRHETTPEIWQETYLSAILRAILYGDDQTFWLEAYRRLNPIPSPEFEVKFLEAAEALFLKGKQPSTSHSGSARLVAHMFVLEQAGKLALTRKYKSLLWFLIIWLPLL